MNSTVSSSSSSTTGSSSSYFTKFFCQFRSPAKKSPSGSRRSSFSSPLPRGNPNYDSDDIHQVFNYFDENGDGKITASELQNRLRKVGGDEIQLSDEEAEIAVRSSDADGDGKLGFDDFTKMMKESEIDELREAFVMYSVKNGSVITPKSLKKMMLRLGQTATVNDCKVMIGRLDVNGDGVLDFDEFRAMMT
ncbi:probable calcium-binding protein CML31 [Rutidosis leptorrhynchoides]|uniref:probable calcium-binding protein CML31 n=1 Tax=Rutidosis leptorrhynchoides TaxID=125765 RepID=UPI003A9A61E7